MVVTPPPYMRTCLSPSIISCRIIVCHHRQSVHPGLFPFCLRLRIFICSSRSICSSCAGFMFLLFLAWFFLRPPYFFLIQSSKNRFSYSCSLIFLLPVLFLCFLLCAFVLILLKIFNKFFYEIFTCLFFILIWNIDLFKKLLTF